MTASAETMPRVSVVIATRNEAAHIAAAIESVLTGTLPSEQVEIIVADGGSTDDTRRIVEGLAARHPNIRLIDNPGRTAPCGFNVAIRASWGQAICLLSAHSYLQANYLEACLAKLDSGQADVAGGPMVTLPGSDNAQARVIMAITSSKFGMGSSFRTVRRDGPADTVVFGVYRRSVFQDVGLFDERLVRNQDNEMNSRARAAGKRVWAVAETSSYYYNRASFAMLVRQNYRNGYYGILTWRINPASFTLRHAVPLLFVLFLLIGGGLSLLGGPLRWGYLGIVGLYVLLAVGAAVQQGIRLRTPLAVLLPPAFVALHLSYGLGSLLGIPRFAFRKPPGPGPAKLPPLTSGAGFRTADTQESR